MELPKLSTFHPFYETNKKDLLLRTVDAGSETWTEFFNRHKETYHSIKKYLPENYSAEFIDYENATAKSPVDVTEEECDFILDFTLYLVECSELLK